MKKNVKILVVVLCLIIVGLVTFIIVDKVTNTKKEEKSNNEDNNVVIAENDNNVDNDKNGANISGKQNETIATNVANGNTITANIASSDNTVVKSDLRKSFSEDDLVIESFRLGESAKAIEAVYSDVKSENKYYTEEATGYNIAELNYTSLGLKVDNAFEDEDDVDGSMIRIEIYGNSSLKTARGIKIGSTKEDILNAYPANSILKSDMIDENKTIIVGYPGSEPVYGSEKGNIYYYLENGKVSEILLAYAVAE